MSSTGGTKVAIIASGNIGTDLMIKVMRLSGSLELAAMAGIDPESDGLARAARVEVPTTADGVDGRVAMDDFADIRIIFDATSAKAHVANAARLAPYGKRLVDLTPAPIGPYVVPPVNLDEDVLVEPAFARPLLFGAALAYLTPEFARDVSAAKVAASAASYAAARAALQVHGAIGYTDEYDPSLWIR
ncbi:acyl-CoA dehydrogenase family protein [Actinoallomurus acaciae]|uniref:Acetaldehyde dehydrogenase n=1 Tax=Actinoallomurus acaciae TaxID=502577 RepID=A0ABV5YDB4_9ACTN